MRMIYLAFALVASLLATTANAANFTAKDASAATIIFTNPGNCTTGCTPIFSWSDSTGTNLVAVLTAGADGASNTANGGLTYARNLVFNGTTWDRWTGAVTVAGGATSALQATGNTTLSSILTALGSPFQAGGSIGNTSFGISGTLPAYAAIPTFKIDQTTPGTTNLVSIGTNGTVNPQTPANWGIGTTTQNSASVANGQMALGQFNTTPTTITSGNMSPLQMDNAGNLLVNIKAGSSSGVVTQGSTTSGQSGPLIQGAVTTAAPTYTTAQTNPLSLTTGGLLRVTDAAAESSLSTIATLAAAPLPVQTGIGNVNIGAVQSAGSNYETVAASQTAQVMGPTGATGDYLSHCVIYPASTSPGVVTVFDNTNAAGTNVIAFAGGATSTSNLTPISVPVGAISTAGPWKVTTGANVSVTCYGKFT